MSHLWARVSSQLRVKAIRPDAARLRVGDWQGKYIRITYNTYNSLHALSDIRTGGATNKN